MNFNIRSTITDCGKVRQKCGAAECGDQHAASVRSPNMSATISIRGQQGSVFSHELLNLAYDTIEFVDEI